MPKKKLALITYEADAKEKYEEQLKDFFGDFISISGYSIVHNEIDKVIDADLFLLSFADLLEYVKDYIPESSHIVFMKRTFMSNYVDQLECLRGESALLIEYSQLLANETIGILNEAGFRDIDLYPVYPGIDDSLVPDLNVAVTTGRWEFVPDHIDDCIDIGWYCVHITTFLDIVERFRISDDILNSRLYEYSKITKQTESGLVEVFKNSWRIRLELETMLDMMDDCVIMMDPGGQILHYNSSASQFIENDGGKIVESLMKILEDEDMIDHRVFEIDEQYFLLSRQTIDMQDERQGYLILLKNVTEIQRLEQGLRIKLAKKGHYARYRFADILTRTPEMIKCIEISKKISPTDLSVLISGESGTGKELFAQAIHCESLRKNMPFVAINCAAFPENLLESELFGYDDGAFTGAKKSGKKGMFELAHGGTIFLDEIGEIPTHTQIRLLRVMQEKEVMRLGGDQVVPVNVRIIAATNVDIEAEVKESKFRRDLYYRLNSAMVNIPPLRERKDDIILMAEHFLKFKKDAILSDELKAILVTMPWDGNVRELKNCIEYMATVGGLVLMPSDLPATYHNSSAAFSKDISERGVLPSEEISITERKYFKGLLPEEALIAAAIIKLLEVKSMGRRKLKLLLENEGYDVSEYKIRRILAILEKNNRIKMNNNRHGIDLVDSANAGRNTRGRP